MDDADSQFDTTSLVVNPSQSYNFGEEVSSVNCSEDETEKKSFVPDDNEREQDM